jgi:hypothetical protein
VGKAQHKEVLFSELSLSFEGDLIVSLPVSHYDFAVQPAVSRPIRQHLLQCIVPKSLEFGPVIALLVGNQVQISEEVRSDDCDLEFHDVHGERASFIREDILDLPQLFVEGRALHCHVLSPVHAVHQLVLFDEVFLEHLDHLH